MEIVKLTALTLVAYSRDKWKPRRATFSVRMERFNSSTVVACANMAATSRGSRMLMSWVSSRAKRIAVKGARMVPPRIAAILTSGQKPVP